LNGKPEAGLIAAHLLNGFTVCGVCGGALTFMSKGKGKGAYRCQRRNSRGLHACSNARGVPEAALDKAVMLALYKVIKDPKKLCALYLERAERWKQERALTVDVRANLEAEEQRLEAAIGRLLDHLEAGEDVGLRLKQRRAELDALRVRLAEPEPVVESEADFQKTVHDHSKPILGWHPNSHDGEHDIVQTRAAMRALGIGKITVTPTPDGWRFEGDGSLAGMVHSGSVRAPHPPQRSSRPGSPGALLGNTGHIAV
jgi:hypothetical protein